MNNLFSSIVLVFIYILTQSAQCTQTLTQSKIITVSRQRQGKSQTSNPLFVGGLEQYQSQNTEHKETGYRQSELGFLFKGNVMHRRYRRSAKSAKDIRRKRKRKNRTKPVLGFVESAIVEEKSGVYFNSKHRSSITAKNKYPSAYSREPNLMLCPVWPTDPKVIVNCSNGRRVRSRCEVRCAPGFRLVNRNQRKRRCRPSSVRGAKKSTPTGNAFWSGRDENFKCVSACEPLISPPNGSWNCDSSPNDAQFSKSCSINCKEGFTVSGTNVRRCQIDGTWSGDNTTCNPNFNSSSKSKLKSFVRHQVLNCGDVYSLTTYRHRDDLFLAAGDKTGNLIRIYRWDGSRFASPPYQTIHHSHPRVIEVLPHNGSKLQLFVDNKDKTMFYLSNKDGKFLKPRISRNFSLIPSKRRRSYTDEIDYIPLNNDIYRCRGRNRRGRSVVLVQKLSKRRTGKRGVFKRVMRRKLKSGENIYRCSMAVAGKKLHTIITTNSQTRGQVGRIIIGVPHKGRMKIIDILKEKDLRKLSDTSGFEDTEHNQYIVAAQTTLNGECFVYKRVWQQSRATG